MIRIETSSSAVHSSRVEIVLWQRLFKHYSKSYRNVLFGVEVANIIRKVHVYVYVYVCAQLGTL